MNAAQKAKAEQIQMGQLRKVAETGECDGRSARALTRLGWIEERASGFGYKLTSKGRKALKDT